MKEGPQLGGKGTALSTIDLFYQGFRLAGAGLVFKSRLGFFPKILRSPFVYGGTSSFRPS